MKNKIILSLFLVMLCLSALGADVIKCGKSGTSFAVITDKVTFEQCQAEIMAYKAILEKEGLGTYIVYSQWNSPDEVKAEILKLSKKRPALEGIVLMGDVPIVMVRGAQHMTTAFKMNEEVYPEFESSVPSDRFYDDFDLSFEFIKRDSLRSDVFYYRLTGDGAQSIRPSIYSARMKVPQALPGDKYETMRRYLRKVVAAHEQDNPLDNLKYFAGHGYNSDCLTLWRQKPLVYREYFPYCFDRASQAVFLNFRQDPAMKFNLFNELQRPGTDFFQFSEHGDYDTQYISSASSVTAADECIERLVRSLAHDYKRYKGTEDDEEFQHEVFDSVFHLSRSLFTDSLMRVYAEKDSLESANTNIYVPDLVKIKSNPRMIVFNACYNASFHREDGGYVAGCHVFGEGDCVVAQGNTVNVLQDKWEDKLMGYLSIGERVGMWQKEFTFLESHLIGDPTYRFTPHNAEEAALRDRLHHDLVFNQLSAKIWAEYLNSKEAIARSAAVIHLGNIADPAFSDAIYKVFCEDKSMTVRVHALNALISFRDENMKKAVLKGFEDSYECVVRTACRIAAATGDPLYLEGVRKLQNTRPDMVRVCERLTTNAEDIITGGRAEKILSKIPGASDERKIDQVRYFRNDRYLSAIEPLLSLVLSSSESVRVRLAACEVLGWYNLSIGRDGIISKLRDYLHEGGDMPSELRSEISKTLRRLE